MKVFLTYRFSWYILPGNQPERRGTMADEFDRYLQYQKEVAEAKLKIIESLHKGRKEKPQKRTSQIDIAWNVLKAAGRPLHVSEIIEIANRDFQEELERDSIVSAILKKASAGRLFIKTAPNTFAAKQD
jgi:HB1, ASXL, restriction endonuclease HTH domain